MQSNEFDRYATSWRPNAKSMKPPESSAGLSGASFYTIPNYYQADEIGNFFSPDGVLKIAPSGSVSEAELDQFSMLQDKLGSSYNQVFIPTQVITLDAKTNLQGTIAPKFMATVAELMRGQEAPPRALVSQIFSNLADTLDILSSSQESNKDNRFATELQESLFLVANVLDLQISQSDPLSQLPGRLNQVADKVVGLVPDYTTLSGNDVWLGNVAVINPKNDIRLFDPLPTLPLINEPDFAKQLRDKNIESPLIRNSLIDYGRVNVNLKRFVLEWNNKGWEQDAQYLESTILPEFRRRSIATIGDRSLLLGELINNAYFSICNCEICSNLGYLNLAYQELDRLIKEINMEAI